MKWPTVKLGDACYVIAGGTPKRSEPRYWEGEIPWVKISDMLQGRITHTDECITKIGLDESAAKLLPKGTLLVSIFATIGRTAVLECEAATNQAIVGVIPKHEDMFDGRFLEYSLQQKTTELERKARGVAQSNINGAVLKATELPLPPLTEQKRIAGILDAADALRSKRRAALAELDTLLQSTFLDMFGDPVTNPMGWEQTELDTLIEDNDRINYGVVQPGDDYPDGRPLIRVGDFGEGRLETKTIKLIDPQIEQKYKRSRLNGSELLVSCVGSIGTVCKVPTEATGFNIARAVARVPLRKDISRDFMLYCLRSKAVQRHFLKETRTVSQPTLNISLIKTAPVIQPPAELQHRFSTIVESVDQQKTRMNTHLTELDTLFASLQSRAFNGEL
jgi:type I restriction enzyme S subunit